VEVGKSCPRALTEHHTVKVYWGVEVSSTHSLASELYGSGQFHTPTTLPQGKIPWYPLDRRLGGPQSHSGHGGEEKKSQPPPGIEP
jgi:hypothetical protein